MKKLLDSKLLVLGGAAAALALVTGMALHQESVLAHGRVVFVELAPADPRSLMQGDYMRLEYALNRWQDVPERGGAMIATLDRAGVASFARYGSVTSGADEVVLRYKLRRGRVRIGPDAYFFEEGQQDRLALAKYGELRVAPNGQSVLVGLRDGALRPLK